MTIVQRGHRALWSAPDRSLHDVVAFVRSAALRTQLLVRVFYAASLVWVLESMGQWPRYLDLRHVDPLWPARWVTIVGAHAGIAVTLGGYLLASLAALALPERRVARFAYAVMLVEYMAFLNSFGKINHNLHGWLYTAAVLVLLPDGRWSRRTALRDGRYFLTVFWSAQLIVLFFYSCTGFWKVSYAVRDLLAGRANAFQFHGFSYIVGERLLQTNSRSVLGDFFLRHEVVGWALFLGTMYLEAASVVIAFRPRLHRAWGIALIAFHVATQLVLGFSFKENVVLVAVLLVFSPLAPDHVSAKAAIRDLPLVHLVAGRVRRGREIATTAS